MAALYGALPFKKIHCIAVLIAKDLKLDVPRLGDIFLDEDRAITEGGGSLAQGLDLIRERVKNGPPLYWTITVGANGQLNAAYLASNPELLDDPANFIGLPKSIADDVRRAIATRTGAGGRGRGGATQSQDEINAIVKRKVAQIRGLGVELVFGTDVGSWGEVTGHATWMEADLWVHELGMDPMTVIRKMTLDAAGVMGAAGESGSLSAGKFADLIAVRGDPLRHMDVLREPGIVVKHGRRYK